MKRSTKIILASLLAVGVSGGVLAYSSHNHWGMSHEEKADFITDRVTRKLDLTDTQQENLKTLATDMMTLVKEVKAGRETHMNQIQDMLAEPVLDQNKALEMIQQKTQNINSKAPAIISSLANFLDSLDAEQKSRLQSFVADRMHHRHNH